MLVLDQARIQKAEEEPGRLVGLRAGRCCNVLNRAMSVDEHEDLPLFGRDVDLMSPVRRARRHSEDDVGRWDLLPYLRDLIEAARGFDYQVLDGNG
jgi:hypothetical protein